MFRPRRSGERTPGTRAAERSSHGHIFHGLATFGELAKHARFVEFPTSSTTSLTIGEPAEKALLGWFLEGKSRSLWASILSPLGSNGRNSGAIIY